MKADAPTGRNPFGNHKDRAPLDTVDKVKAILNTLGIGDGTPIRETPFNPAPQCFSLNILDPEYPILSANGKGVTQEYSRASAYAEFIERLQCCHDVRFSRLGGIFPSESIHPDETDVPVTELWRDIPEIMCELVEDVDAIPVETLPCLPFWDACQGKECLLPYGLMFWKTYSTGMCAGNTPEESLVQGICEVMERHVARQVMDGGLCAPTIPGEQLRRCSPGLRRMIDELENSGLKLVVKDCTMGGSLPVLAAIVINEANDRFGLDFGCDPVFDVALQRCITELYQGRLELAFEYSYWKAGPPPLKDYFNNVHPALARLLPNAPAAQYQDAFTAKGRSNTEYLRFLMGKVRSAGAQVYVRDFSFLGFPSHYVYIQGLPALDRLSSEESRFILQDAAECLDIMFRIHEENKEDILRLARLYAGKLQKETPFSGCLVNALCAPFLPIPVMVWLHPRTFVSFVLIEAGLLADALVVLEDSREAFTKGPEKELWLLLTDYCRFMGEKNRNKEIQTLLIAKHGPGPYGRSIPHLMNQHWASLYCKELEDTPGRKFDGLPIPRCSSPFSCVACPLNRKCLLNRFARIRKKSKEAYQLLDQTRLGRVCLKI